MSTSIFGGTVGVVVTFLITVTHDKDIPAFYLMAGGLIGLYPILRMRETAKVPIDQVGVVLPRPALRA